MPELAYYASIYRLLGAEGFALTDGRREKFVLLGDSSEAQKIGSKLPVGRSPEIDITDNVVSGRLRLTIDGASTLTLVVHDPEWLIEASGLLDLNADGRLGSTTINVNGVWFSLAQVTRQDPDLLTLVFEDLTVAILREFTRAMKASRGSVTRAEFIGRMVNELPKLLRLFFSPEQSEHQPVEDPQYPTATVKANKKGDVGGFTANERIPIDSDAFATDTQKEAMATTLTVCDQLGVSMLVRQAIVCAGLGESEFDPSKTDYATHTHKGVFQSNQIPQYDTETQARHFLQGGRSFLAGGAIRLARDNPTMLPGEIATRVEISNGSGSYYQSFLPTAKKIIQHWHNGSKGASSTSGDTVYVLQQYQFTRGIPGKKESSWDAMQRLAQEVDWRCFVTGGVVVYASDQWLIDQPPRETIKPPGGDDDQDANGPLIAWPTYDWDQGKIAAQVGLQVWSERWSQLPGTVVELADGFGPITGSWLVQDVDHDLFDETDCRLTLTKPVPKKKEPAPSVETLTKDEAAKRGSGTGTVYYVGDSLGVGTMPYFQRILSDRRIGNNVFTGRTSTDAASWLEHELRQRHFDNIVFDVGTNDPHARELRDSIKRVRRLAPEAHVYVFTLNTPFDEAAKNKLLEHWKDPKVHVVQWREYVQAHNVTLDSAQHIHPDAAGYKARAHLLARQMGFES